MNEWMDGWVDGWMDGWIDGMKRQVSIGRCWCLNIIIMLTCPNPITNADNSHVIQLFP